MRIRRPPVVAAGAAGNPDFGYYQRLGVGTGIGTLITSGGANNTEGAYAGGLLGTAAFDFSAIRLECSTSVASTHRFLVSVSTDGGATTKVPKLYLMPDNTGWPANFNLPVRGLAGAEIRVRAQAGGASNTFYAKATLQRAVPGGAPGFDNAVPVVGPDNANTRAASVPAVVSLTNTGAWTQIGQLSHDVGALLVMLSDNGTNPASAQVVEVTLAVGPPGSEVAIGGFTAYPRSTAPALARAVSPLIQTAIASGEYLSANILAVTPGAGPDKLAVQVVGFY